MSDVVEEHFPHRVCNEEIKSYDNQNRLISHHCDFWTHAGIGSHKCKCGFSWQQELVTKRDVEERNKQAQIDAPWDRLGR